METNTEVTVVKQNDTAIYLLAKAEIDTQIATAKAFPRSIKEFYDKAISMATVSESVAASCSYAVPRGGKIIEGGSVRLAEIVLASYKNLRAGARVILNDGKKITAQGICHDLENNNCVTIEVSTKIQYKDGTTYNDDMQNNIGNATCSKALRNAIFKVVPQAMINEIREAAKQCAKGSLASLDKRRTAAMEYFKGLGIKEKQIFEVLEVKGIEEIDLDKLQILTGFKSAIVNEGMSAKELFEKKPELPATTVEAKPLAISEMLDNCHTQEDIELLKSGNPDLTEDEMKLVDAKEKEIKSVKKK